MTFTENREKSVATTATSHRDLIRQRAAAGSGEARFVNTVLNRREAGTHRQMTPAEIMARAAERQAAGMVTHGARVHSALNPCEDCV